MNKTKDMAATLNIPRWIASQNFFLFYIFGDNNIQSIGFGVYYCLSLGKLPCQVVVSTNLDWVMDCDIYK